MSIIFTTFASVKTKYIIDYGQTKTYRRTESDT